MTPRTAALVAWLEANPEHWYVPIFSWFTNVACHASVPGTDDQHTEGEKVIDQCAGRGADAVLDDNRESGACLDTSVAVKHLRWEDDHLSRTHWWKHTPSGSLEVEGPINDIDEIVE